MSAYNVEEARRSVIRELIDKSSAKRSGLRRFRI
jgi:hypothetical protein